MADLEEGRCKHGEIADWCGECKTAGQPHVWRTAYGLVYHRKQTCKAMHDGLRKAERIGKQASTPEQVPLSVAMGEGLAECMQCFPHQASPGLPRQVPPDVKPCQVFVDGKWVDGFLLEWRRGTDNRWKGLVKYRWETGLKSAIKDQSELRSGNRQRN